MTDEGMPHAPLELSPLATDSEPARWDAIVASTLDRVDEVLARREANPAYVIVNWSRQVLAAAAIVTALLIPVELVLEKREPSVNRLHGLVDLSSHRTDAGPPSKTDFLLVLSGGRR